MQLGIPVLALFPVIEPNLKTPDGIEATRPDGLVARTVSAIKKHFPELGVLHDVALDPSTTNGQDGITADSGNLFHAPTRQILTPQAPVHADATGSNYTPNNKKRGAT